MGWAPCIVYDNEPPDPALCPSAGVLTYRAEALRSALAEADTTISTLSHWSKPEAAPWISPSWAATGRSLIE